MAYRTKPVEMTVLPAPANRKWMDDTDHRFANRCLPLLMANQWGWFILNDRRIELLWNGGQRVSDLHIHYAKKAPDEQVDCEKLLAVSHFGHAVLTWRIPFLFETPPGWNLYVRGPANWCKDGACPLDGVAETDWSSAAFTMNWKITRPDTWIRFERGEPICQIFPVERGSVERFLPEVRALARNPELERRYKGWRQCREQFNRELHRSGAKALWQKHYFRGTSILGEAFRDHQTKLVVREFGGGPVGAGLAPAPEDRSQSPAPAAESAEGRATTRAAPATASRAEARRGRGAVPAPAAESDRLGQSAGAVDFQVVVSSENNSYMAWQTQLFCFSALTRLGKHATVVVHRNGGPLRPEFETVRSWGCRVIGAPRYSAHPRGAYPPRNEIGSLLTIAAHPDFRNGHVLFCEADMLFVKAPKYSGELSGEHYGYLDYGQTRVEAVARKFGVTASPEELNRAYGIGVPYLIPGPLLPRIADRWLEVLDSFEELDWIDVMYAFGLALSVESLPVGTTRLMADNRDPVKKLHGSVIHYCYGDARWGKRSFRNGDSPLSPLSPVPPTRGLSGTVLGDILHQIRQARAYSRFPRAFRAIWQLTAG